MVCCSVIRAAWMLASIAARKKFGWFLMSQVWMAWGNFRKVTLAPLEWKLGRQGKQRRKFTEELSYGIED